MRTISRTFRSMKPPNECPQETTMASSRNAPLQNTWVKKVITNKNLHNLIKLKRPPISIYHYSNLSFDQTEDNKKSQKWVFYTRSSMFYPSSTKGNQSQRENLWWHQQNVLNKVKPQSSKFTYKIQWSINAYVRLPFGTLNKKLTTIPKSYDKFICRTLGTKRPNNHPKLKVKVWAITKASGITNSR